MHRYYVDQAIRAIALSPFERDAVRAALVLLAAGVVAAFAGGDAGGLARSLGAAGLVALVVCAASRAVRYYRAAGLTAALPASVGRAQVRTRPLRLFTAATLLLALGLPLAAAAALVAATAGGWLVLTGVLLFGSIAMFLTWVNETRRGEDPYAPPSPVATELLRRLCMRADLPAPALVVTPGPVAIAWTAGGRIHVTRRLLQLLDDGELEAVLAHELAHVAHRDAAVMEICSAPSRLLLAFARTASRWFVRWMRSGAHTLPGGGLVAAVLASAAGLAGPPAFLIGWTSRLSVLGISRAREFAADAAAATLTGRPSALASALMKLERQGAWTPRADLRQVEPIAVLCIVGTDRSRLFSTHPPVAARVRRPRELEARIQAA